MSSFGALGLAAGCSSGQTYKPDKMAPSTPKGDLDRLEEAVVSGGPGKDGIPAIDEPRFVDAGEMDGLLKPDDIVFVLDYGEETKVYPQKVLVWHEIVNDRVADEKLTVTYCPLTGSAVAFKGRSTQGKPLTFGTTGRLVNSNLLMYDRQTESEWPQILGNAITGGLRGESLIEAPLVWTTWKKWRENGPSDVQVLSTETGYVRSYGEDPYGSYTDTGDDIENNKGYYYSSEIYFPVLAETDRLAKKSVVLGIKSGRERLAIPKDTVLKRRVMNLDAGGKPLVAVGNPELEMAWVFERNLDGKILDLRPGEDGALLDGKGRAWKRNGLVLEGPGGVRLPAANFYEVMWFAWYAFFPKTRLTA